MKSLAFIATLAALANAQDIVWKVVDPAPEPAMVTPPIGVTSSVSSYEPTAAASSVAAEVSEGAGATTKKKRAFGGVPDLHIRDNACAQEPLGSGPTPSPDTAEAFLSSTDFSGAATGVQNPVGYSNTFRNLKASNSAYGFMGVTTLPSYDPAACAAQCNNINGCSAINIYFERDPSKNPADACPNPPSTTVIKCVFWGGPVNAGNANNQGQWRNSFQVVIAGSNGYTKDQNYGPQPGYDTPVDLDTAAINAPLDCNGHDTFMGSKIFTIGPFDASLCAAACTAQTQYNVAHPPQDGSAPMTCQFFNTFMLMKNGNPEGQYCAMYNQTWDHSYATNVGQHRGDDHYTIAWSLAFSNSTDPGVCCTADLQTDNQNCGACGNACPSGNRCSAGKCVTSSAESEQQCWGSTQPQTCSFEAYCDKSTNTYQCYCVGDVEGTNSFCWDYNKTPGGIWCDNFSRCDASSDCGSNQLCISTTCCPHNICIDATLDCPNPNTSSRLFRHRRELEGKDDVPAIPGAQGLGTRDDAVDAIPAIPIIE